MLGARIVAALLLAAILSPAAVAQQPHSDAATARSMLERAIRELQVDRAAALRMFADPSAFRALGGQIYVSCFDRITGKLATGQNTGADVRSLKDKNGRAWGQEVYDVGQRPEGEIVELSYMAPKPGPDRTEVPKTSFVARVPNTELVCGVGYYP